MKRLFDMVFGVIALVLLSPLLVVVALLVRIRMGSPVLFRQQRPGLHGKPFEMVKFRSMLPAPPGSTTPDDAARLTPFGAWLRRTSCDELPELWNVIRGEMSFVGPRPLLMEYLPLYTPQQARRHEVRPGITGWAQINGRNDISWDDKLALDVWYVEHRSFALDMRILFRTVFKVASADGVVKSGHATTEKFKGSQR